MCAQTDLRQLDRSSVIDASSVFVRSVLQCRLHRCSTERCCRAERRALLQRTVARYVLTQACENKPRLCDALYR